MSIYSLLIWLFYYLVVLYFLDAKNTLVFEDSSLGIPVDIERVLYKIFLWKRLPTSLFYFEWNG
jgi:hypothetical protein